MIEIVQGGYYTIEHHRVGKVGVVPLEIDGNDVYCAEYSCISDDWSLELWPLSELERYVVESHSTLLELIERSK